MASSFHLQVVTPAEMVFDGPVESVTAPGLDGYFGVLAHHAPLIAALGEGEMTIRAGSVETKQRLKGGFMEVSNNRAIVIADNIEPTTS